MVNGDLETINATLNRIANALIVLAYVQLSGLVILALAFAGMIGPITVIRW